MFSTQLSILVAITLRFTRFERKTAFVVQNFGIQRLLWNG